MYRSGYGEKNAKQRKIVSFIAWLLTVFLTGSMILVFSYDIIKYSSMYQKALTADGEQQKYIKWAEFNAPYAALEAALAVDMQTYGSDRHIGWVELLSLLATKYGGTWKRYKQKDLDTFVKGLTEGEPFEEVRANKYYYYFYEVYDSVLSQFVGEYAIELPNDDGTTRIVEQYGLTAFSPIAEGFSFSHYDDFGNSRSYGYKRRHLGHDIMGAVGTPIIAIEGGTVEELGWNQYGGWRIGIRSYDKKRYYYYAHLRKDLPFHASLVKGGTVSAGDVIGYMGMTGYSATENVNNINVPHLHLGLQLIFDESQKEGTNQIWIDLYKIFMLLQKNKATVTYDSQTKDYNKLYKVTRL